jgi:tRNA threonylcarbamoyladenosine biosynthesis protein TsaE
VHSDPIPSLAAKGHLALDLSELLDWGERLGRWIQPPSVVALKGELGAGKTTLTQAICRGYGVTSEVSSPTFTLVHEYESAKNLGWDDMLRDRALIIVEWPERASALMPHGHIPIELAHLADRPDHRLLYAGGHT